MTNTILNHPLVKLFFVITLAAGLILGIMLPLAPVAHAASLTVFHGDVKRPPLAPASMASAAIITVTTTNDEYGTGPGCSLREAVGAAGTDSAFGGCPAGSGDDVISLPAGTYVLTQTGPGEDLNVTGDLDIYSTMTISGAGAGVRAEAA